MTHDEFMRVYRATENNATVFFRSVVQGDNYQVNYCGGGIYTRHLWDTDTGEIYRFQIITHIAPDMLLITEWCALDGDKVWVWYADNTRLIEE